MLEYHRIETASPEILSIWCRSDIAKSTWRTHRYFVDFESRIHVEISTSNRCHNFHVDSPFKIDVISTNFPRWISMSNRWHIGKDVPIGKLSKLHTRKRRVLGNTSIHLRLAPAQDPTLMFEQTRLRRLLMFIVIIFELFTLLCCIPLNMCPVRQNTP